MPSVSGALAEGYIRIARIRQQRGSCDSIHRSLKRDVVLHATAEDAGRRVGVSHIPHRNGVGLVHRRGTERNW